MTAVVSLLLVTGLRRSELLGLAWDCVDLDAGTITIRRVVIEVEREPVLREQPKSDAGWRTIGISGAVADLMRTQKAYVSESALAWGKGYSRDPWFCFPGWGGQPMAPMSMTMRLRKIMRQAGVTGIQPVHGWRHTSATLLIDAGENIKTVQARLGHSTPAITMALYVHPVDERDRAAAERLGALLPKSSK
jgi:integrase